MASVPWAGWDGASVAALCRCAVEARTSRACTAIQVPIANSGARRTNSARRIVSVTSQRGPAQRCYFPGMSWWRLTLALAQRAAFRPRLALDLVNVAWRFRRRGWSGRPPFLPLPPSEYIRWRMYTAYGDEDAHPSLEDVERYARWNGR